VQAGLTVFRGQDAGWQVVAAAEADLVVDAVSGIAGLWPALAALRPGATLAMASKEPMVAAGDILRDHAAAVGAQIYPVDSETTAVAQCLAHVPAPDVVRVYVTASGGPLWGRDPSTFGAVQPEEAVRHPRWAMGPKISVDSATMFNKGLEVIEISRFFELPLNRLAILVHPQSVTHAAVEFRDGSIMAQLGPTDMRVSIAQAMFWPDRPPDSPVRLAMDGQRLEFARPDLGPWPCLRAALSAAAEGGTAPVAVSAADEVLVSSFLGGGIGFNDLGCGLWATLAAHRTLTQTPPHDGVPGGVVPPFVAATPAIAERIAAISRIDAWARQFAAAWVVEEGCRAARLDPRQIGEDYRG
jgi:1-deoxy-D-xylulose-5-phosphate reductoisomerase